jgi:MFS family permease
MTTRTDEESSANGGAPAAMTGRQWLTVMLLLGTGFMLSVDFSILNVAMPQVGAAVGIGLADLPWIATAYALPAAGFTLLFGRIADLYGRRRLFLIGIGLLAVSSIIGGFATNAELLLIARTLQGFATAIATPAALALLITSFSDEKQRARVLGLNGALLSGGFTVGALVGGALVGILSWRWAFLINVPVAVIILAVTPFAIRPSKAPVGVKLDVPGALAVTLGLLAFVFGVTDRNLFALIGGLVLLAAFWMIELRAKAPLVALSILARPTVKWGNLATLVVFSTGSSLVFLLTLYLQDVLHFEPMTTGLIFGVPGLASVVAGVIAGRFIARHGSRKVLVVGLLAQAALTAPLVLLGPSNLWLVLLIPALFLGFFGHVTAIVASIVTATSGVDDSEQGLATGLASMTQQVGITIGIPILGAVAATQADLLSGIHLALGANVAMVVIAIVLLWTGLRSRPKTASGAASDEGLRGRTAQAAAE